MFKKYSALALIVILFHVFNTGPVQARTLAGGKEVTVEKVKRSVEKLGVGEKARTTVKLKDGTTHKGYVYQANEDTFVVVDGKTGQKTTIAYADVRAIKGHNMSTGAKIGLGIGIAAATIAIAGSLLVLAVISAWD